MTLCVGTHLQTDKGVKYIIPKKYLSLNRSLDIHILTNHHVTSNRFHNKQSRSFVRADAGSYRNSFPSAIFF
jgi:uncharacterized Zn-finger protein